MNFVKFLRTNTFFYRTPQAAVSDIYNASPAQGSFMIFWRLLNFDNFFGISQSLNSFLLTSLNFFYLTEAAKNLT